MIGIVGGMGIVAGREFDAELRSFGINTARSDNEHPCRVSYLLGTGPSPVSSITDAILNLHENGATKFVLACNTAHAVYDELIDNLPEGFRDDVYHLINIVFENVHKPLWLGTTTLCHNTNLVRHRSKLPNDKDQETVQHAIWMAKSCQFPYSSEIRHLCTDHDTIVAGCTEMPAILHNTGIKYVDPVHLLANSIK